MLEIKQNPNRQKYDEVTEAVKQNDGHCPCMIEKNKDTKCICKEFKESKDEGPCRCGRFIKVEVPSIELSKESKQRIFEEDIMNSELHPDRYGGDTVYECKKVWEAWTNTKNDGYEETVKNTLIKYLSRFGKKDDKLKEAEKIFNYAKFLLEYEIKIKG